MPHLSFYIRSNYHYLILMAIFFFCTLTACAAQQSKFESSYYCELTRLAICDKKSYTSCTTIPNTDFTEPVHTVFHPETLTAQSYEGSRLIQEVNMSFWQTLDNTILMAGHGINTEGDVTVWSGSIDRKNGDLIVTALSVDYSYIVNGNCHLQ